MKNRAQMIAALHWSVFSSSLSGDGSDFAEDTLRGNKGMATHSSRRSEYRFRQRRFLGNFKNPDCFCLV